MNDLAIPPGRLRPRAAHALALLGTVLLAGTLAACASGGAGTSVRTQTAAVTAAGLTLTPTDTLTSPFEITSVGGVLDVTLAAVFQDLNVPGQGTLNLRTYQVLYANGVDYTDSAKYGFPGPTLRAFRGDSIHVVLVNNMFPVDSDTTCLEYPASADSVDVMQDCFHGANWTNIHYHGMHVTPDSVGDDVLLLIPPGATHEYGFRIPWNQSPGTHWYHPHKHGSVAIQVMNGMTGALIVDGGGLDSLADQHKMRERLIAFQQIMQKPNLMSTSTFAPQVSLANGQLRPVILMAPGEVQRWRLVDENFNKTSGFRISFADTTGIEPALYDVARDGVTYANVNYAPNGTPVPDTAVLMSPGNRLDVFVRAPMNPGTFRLDIDLIEHDRPNDRTRNQRLRDNQDPFTGAVAELAAAGSAADTNFVFFVQVVDTIPHNGSTLPISLPLLPNFLANLPGPLRPDSIDTNYLPTIVFADSGFNAQSHTNPTRFFLGTAQNPWMKFNAEVVYTPQSPSGVPMPMILDSVQTWLVANQSLATNHPFHIHINPFQVISVFAPNHTDPNAALYAELNAAAQVRRTPVWLDVLALPLPRVDTARTSSGTIVRIDTIPGFIIIRQAYAPFLNADGTVCTNCGPAWGEFVMHCHILGHEERGMMQAIQIIPYPGWVGQPGAGGHGAHGSSPGSTAPAAPPGHPHRH